MSNTSNASKNVRRFLLLFALLLFDLSSLLLFPAFPLLVLSLQA